MNKEVTIIGLANNKQLGILKAFKMEFSNDRLQIIKGAVGQGKTTLKTTLDLGTKGQKSLTDKSLYGEVDVETQLLDGENKIFIGCKSKVDGSLEYTLYIKDINGKIVREPVIDGVKATPSKYLETLQTELTWRMDELVSENPVVQRKILLDLYKFELQKQGVIFDSKHPEYSTGIIAQVETAIKERDLYDMVRKQKGGILDDLKAKGFDPDRPATIPDTINVSNITKKITEIETQIALSEQKLKNDKEIRLEKLRNDAKYITNQCKQYNEKLELQYQIDLSEFNKLLEIEIKKDLKIKRCNELMLALFEEGYNGNDVKHWIELLPTATHLKTPIKPKLIEFDSKGIVVVESEGHLPAIVEMFKNLNSIREKYICEVSAIQNADNTPKLTEIETLKESLKNASEINKIVEAVDAFHNWRNSNGKVQQLKNSYYKKLADINTGVEGLKIICDEKTEELFLMYNGAFDTTYFNNPDKEYRKLSSYSGTQKPLICLLIQSYLLNKKPKALRYMYIDNVPMDKRTQEVLCDMCYKLKMRVFLNITGDFEVSSLANGEILVENGEVFFNE